MKYFRIGISLLCILSICLSAVFFVKSKMQDKTYPVITIDEQIIDVSINVTDEGLLKGVTAYDKKDGDITSKIYIESISKFVEHGIYIATVLVHYQGTLTRILTGNVTLLALLEPVGCLRTQTWSFCMAQQ